MGLNLDVTNIVVNILLKPDMLKINDEIGVIGYYLNIKPFYTNHYKLNNTSLVYKLFSGQLN